MRCCVQGVWVVLADRRFSVSVCLTLSCFFSVTFCYISVTFATGLSFLVGTDLDGLFTLRVAIGQSTTQLEHVKRVWGIIQEQAGKMLQEKQQQQQPEKAAA